MVYLKNPLLLFESRPIVLLAGCLLATLVAAPVKSGESVSGVSSEPINEGPQIRSIAFRVHNMEPMVAFYREAFGVEFRPVDTFGVASQFGELAGVTLKLVPIRDADDFIGYPDLQLGLEVEDIEAIIAIAQKHGGRAEGELRSEADLLHGAVRDPDGNTIELYQAKTR